MHADVFLAGLFAGIVVGLTGIGAGSLLAPALVSLFGFNPLTAVASALVVKSTIKWMEAGSHVLQRNVNYKVGGILVAGGAPAAIAAVATLWALRHFDFQVDRWTHWALAVIALAAGVASLLKPLYSFRFHEGDVRVLASLKVRVTACILAGISGGALIAFTAVGGGAVVVPLLGLLYLMPVKKVAGTDAFQTAIVASSAALVHGIAGHVSWALSANLLVGAIPGAAGGLWLAYKRLDPEAVVRSGVGLLAAAIGIWMLVTLVRGGGTPAV
jgi:uncharacterized membrane protein YfcA